MPKYTVIAVMEVGYKTSIEAKDDEDAFKKAEELELEEFENTGSGSFRIYDTYKEDVEGSKND
tara:strand:+ start:1975 stop:2163 length:189 start_codon:yes stop_codon:yes gene_type:complete